MRDNVSPSAWLKARPGSTWDDYQAFVAGPQAFKTGSVAKPLTKYGSHVEGRGRGEDKKEQPKGKQTAKEWIKAKMPAIIRNGLSAAGLAAFEQWVETHYPSFSENDKTFPIWPQLLTAFSRVNPGVVAISLIHTVSQSKEAVEAAIQRLAKDWGIPVEHVRAFRETQGRLPVSVQEVASGKAETPSERKAREKAEAQERLNDPRQGRGMGRTDGSNVAPRGNEMRYPPAPPPNTQGSNQRFPSQPPPNPQGSNMRYPPTPDPRNDPRAGRGTGRVDVKPAAPAAPATAPTPAARPTPPSSAGQQTPDLGDFNQPTQPVQPIQPAAPSRAAEAQQCMALGGNWNGEECIHPNQGKTGREDPRIYTMRECEAKGGEWDYDRDECIMPQPLVERPRGALPVRTPGVVDSSGQAVVDSSGQALRSGSEDPDAYVGAAKRGGSVNHLGHPHQPGFDHIAKMLSYWGIKF